MAIDLSALDDLPQAKPTLVAPTAPLSTFEEDPNNPRTEFDDPEFEDFVEDVRERGILQPVMVRPIAGGKLRIQFGARRYRAAVRLQLAELPYFITEDERQFDDYAQVAENEQRKNLQPLELATFIAKKLAAGEKKKDIAAKLKIAPSALTNLLSLIDAPEFLLTLYHRQQCRTPQYIYELRKLYERNPALVEQRCADAAAIDRKLISSIDAEITAATMQAAAVMNGQHRARASDVMGSGVPISIVTANVQPRVAEGTPRMAASASVELPAAPQRIRQPVALARYQKLEVIVLLTHQPSEPGLVMICFTDDRSEAEVPIGDLVMTELREA